MILRVLSAAWRLRRLDDPTMVRVRAEASAAVKQCLDEEEDRW